MRTTPVHAFSLLLVVPACLTFVDDPPAHEEHLSAAPPLGVHPDGARSPIHAGPPRAATGSRSLFEMTFAASAPIERVVGDEQLARVDVIEQAISKMTEAPVVVTVELAPPTGQFDRLVVSDTVRGEVHTDLVLCQSYGVATFDPRCETVIPAAVMHPRAGAIAEARWQLSMIDDRTELDVPCTTLATHGLRCTLPAGRATYRLVVSANGFQDLWDRPQVIGPQALATVPFIGAIIGSEWSCFDWRTTTNADYCAARTQFTRFEALDRARLELDPLQLTLTAGGYTSTHASDALTWDAGDDDLPGTY